MGLLLDAGAAVDAVDKVKPLPAAMGGSEHLFDILVLGWVARVLPHG
jgi:hypothetical protein